MRGLPGRIITATVAATFLAALTPLAAASEQVTTTSGPPSAEIFLVNGTHCDLHLNYSNLEYGEWMTSPPPGIGKQQVVSWKSQANGAFTGTGGMVDYMSYNCENGDRSNLPIILHWYKGFTDGNLNYDAQNTDSRFRVNMTGTPGPAARIEYQIFIR